VRDLQGENEKKGGHKDFRPRPIPQTASGKSGEHQCRGQRGVSQKRATRGKNTTKFLGKNMGSQIYS